MKQINSETIISQREAGSATGIALGSHGSATPANSPRVVEWLVQRSPSTVDKALQSQALSRNVALQIRYDTKSVRDSNGNVLSTSFYAKSCKAIGQTHDLADVQDKIAAAMTPAEPRRIEGWLAELSVIVARRKDDEFSETLRIEAYAARLKAYPADVARAALLEHNWRFWPSWAELADVCDDLVAPRQAMLSSIGHSLHDAANPPAPPAPGGKGRDMKEAAAEILSQAGFTAERIDTVRKAPLATTLQEAEARAVRVPHWTETAPPDDVRWQHLKYSRSQNKLMNGGGE